MLFRIHESRLPDLKKKLEKLNKIAAKLSFPPVHFDELYDEYVEGANEGEMSRYIYVEVDGFAPQIAGWEVAAIIKHLPNDAALVQTMPGHTVPDKFWNAKPICEHCGKTRKRNDTFVLVKDGEYKQVGRTCLADFTGHPDPKDLASWAEALGEFQESCEAAGLPGQGGVKYVNLSHFLGYVAAVMRQKGWVSRSTALATGKTATADIAWQWMTAKNKNPEQMPTEKDMELVQKALQWAASIPQDGSTDFERKIRALAVAQAFPPDMHYLAAATLAAYEKQKKQGSTSKHLHLVGDTVMVTLTVKLIFHNSKWGSRLYILEDALGNVYKWSTSSGLYLEKGKTYKLIGKVKDNIEYKGIKQTVLTKVKLA